ncbi:MAG: hypothetical protein ACJZ8Q_00510 [Paracoccaceae bacterium]
MQELEELEIRLAKALNRIAALTNTLSKSNIHPNIERSDRLEQHILKLTDQLEAQETENIRLLKVVTKLQEHNKNFDLAENEQTDLSDQINDSLRAEIANLNALRARDLAEIDEILKAIDPILIQGQN